MDLKEALQKAELELGGTVISVFDCDDRWVFNFDWQVDTLSSVVWCCYKTAGEISCFFPPDEPEVGERAKRIRLPEAKK